VGKKLKHGARRELKNALSVTGKGISQVHDGILPRRPARFFTESSLNFNQTADSKCQYGQIVNLKKVPIMKKLLLLSGALVSSGLVLSQEVGRVISSTPLIQQVNVPRQVCTTETVAVQQQKSGAGALIGAIAGGAMGNAVGGGNGKAAATMIGLTGGAILGDQIEGAPQSQFQNVQRCGVQSFYENRTVAYNVVYEFSGKQYSVQMPHDPGPTIRLQISPVGSSPATNPPVVAYQPPVYIQPTRVVVLPQTYGGHDRRYYTPYSRYEYDDHDGDNHRGRRHWR
jgi:uncharacterized protein YcfJ